MTDNAPILILGATSGIARCVAAELARQGHALILAGRDGEELERLADDLRLRHQVQVWTQRFEALDFDAHDDFLARCEAECDGHLSGLVLAYGVMEDQAHAAADFTLARQMIDINYTSAVSICNRAAAHFQNKGDGFLCALSSVAGDRGRASNYLYGSTKAALSAYLEGLGAALRGSGVRVITVKPGPVDTPMTRGRGGRLASPHRVARDIVRGIERGREMVYTPWHWRWIMAVIRAMPRAIFKRMKI